MRSNLLLVGASSVAAVLALASGCGSATRSADRLAAAGPAVSTPDPTYQDIHTNWDDPEQGSDTILASPADAERNGVLGFAPLIPDLGVPVWRTVVSNRQDVSRRNLYLVFHFPIGADFPTDGRVVIVERPPGSLDAQAVQDMITGVPNSSPLNIDGDAGVLLRGDSGNSGAIILVHDVVVEITGPTLTPDLVQRLAQKFLDSLPTAAPTPTPSA